MRSAVIALPRIDVTALRERSAGEAQVAREIDAACRELGFFRITGHGVPPELFAALDACARGLFAQSAAAKARIAMQHAGRAWRGWFPLGGELTSGVPDQKEGIYFGAELPLDDPRVRAGRPLHGPNLFPDEPAELRAVVLAWIEQLTALAHAVMRGIALGLGLPGDWFRTQLTADPTVLFRIFRYPPTSAGAWGVGEHTDYGLLTLLAQDDRGGLEVRGPDGYIEVPPEPDVFVCNLGDMLDRLTGGRYRSTAHRARNAGASDRLAFPFFFDPSWDATVPVLPLAAAPPAPRWDGADLAAWTGTYGEYLTAKVSRVFPALFAATTDS